MLGASHGIGEAVARRLHADGHHVTVVARSADRVNAVVNDLEGAIGLGADLTDPGGVARVREHCRDTGQPHIVVSLVHVRRKWARVAATPPSSVSESVHDHLAHIVEIAADALPSQRSDRFGRWVFMSSLVASIGGHGQSVYAAQKAAMEAMSRSLAIEEGRNGITANAIELGFFDVERTNQRYDDQRLAELRSFSAVERAGRVEEAAHAVSFLSDERAGFVTGATIPVTGGAELGWWLTGSSRSSERG